MDRGSWITFLSRNAECPMRIAPHVVNGRLNRRAKPIAYYLSRFSKLDLISGENYAGGCKKMTGNGQECAG